MEAYVHQAWLDCFMARWCRERDPAAELITQRAYNAFCARVETMKEGCRGGVYQQGKYKPSNDGR